MSDLCVMDHDKPKHTDGNLHVCHWHATRTQQAIAETPALYTALERRLAPTGSTITGMPNGTKTHGIDINHRVATHRTDMRNSLATWARIAVEERHMTTPADTLPAIAAFIVAQIDWYLAHPGTRTFVNDMLDNADTAHRLLDPNPTRSFEVGPCPEPGCDGRLWARLRAKDALLPTDVTCDTSPETEDGTLLHYWPADKWLTLGRRLTRNQASA